MRRTHLIAGAALCGLIAGCSPGEPQPPPSAPASRGPAPTTPSAATLPSDSAVVATLPCDESIAAPPSPGEGYEVVLGVVALPTATATAALQASRDPGPPVRYFAKRGLVIRTDAAFDLTVIGPADLDATVGWGSPGRFARTVRVPGCPADGAPGWRAYAGGFQTAATGCLTLQVSTTQRSARVRIGIGAPCPGQDPPPSPSDR